MEMSSSKKKHSILSINYESHVVRSVLLAATCIAVLRIWSVFVLKEHGTVGYTWPCFCNVVVLILIIVPVFVRSIRTRTQTDTRTLILWGWIDGWHVNPQNLKFEYFPWYFFENIKWTTHPQVLFTTTTRAIHHNHKYLSCILICEQLKTK